MPRRSKQVLSGAWGPERTRLARFAGAFTGIELLLGVRAESLDISASSITLATGAAMSFDVAVIATDACPVPSPWDDAEGVHVLRSRPDPLVGCVVPRTLTAAVPRTCQCAGRGNRRAARPGGRHRSRLTVPGHPP